ncbi:hypothetical protein HPB51_001959 [Rhipicephalus microplus]|uniref:CCHC-type domain-containing protein n=1 Tax=Rhipicephalus microplus TaxID=6941 RepID=A0A9J6DXX0_RHIMP|nr:hypothetical protein HPB51_001959 [Rhipicephalus microplus]
MCRTVLWTRTRTAGRPPLPGSVSKNGNPVLQCTRGYSIAEPPLRLVNGHLVAQKDHLNLPPVGGKGVVCFRCHERGHTARECNVLQPTQGPARPSGNGLSRR